MKKEFSKLEIEKIIQNSNSKSDACKAIGFNLNGNGFRKLEKLIYEYNLDIKHFDKGYSKRNVKYVIIEKECPVCASNFFTKKGHKHEKKTCSHSCSNSYFRSGLNNPNWKDERYRTTCFLYHKKECVVCGENKIVDVHHFDENKKNNSPENLIPICPTHHTYWHSRYKEDVYDKVIEYRNKFINNRDVD